MRQHAARAAVMVVVIAALGLAACQNPSGPSPGAAPPMASPPPDPPAISCPAGISALASGASGTPVSYPTPQPHFGQPPVAVTCAPESGAAFPVGSTPVTCRASDSLNRTAECTFSVTVAAPPRLRLTRIVAFGDSITSGEVVKPGTEDAETMPARDPYPAVLQRLVNERYPGQAITITNAGKGGEQAVEALARFGGALRLANAEAVIILQGFNDLLRGTLPDNLEAALSGVGTLAAEARNRGVRVYIATLTPTRPGRRSIPIGIVQAANARLRDGARGEGAQLIDLFTPLLADLNNNIGSDGLHPTELGYRRIAEAVFEALQRDLEIRPSM
jgi:lysophospholipase L1-like esterase